MLKSRHSKSKITTEVIQARTGFGKSSVIIPTIIVTQFQQQTATAVYTLSTLRDQTMDQLHFLKQCGIPIISFTFSRNIFSYTLQQLSILVQSVQDIIQKFGVVVLTAQDIHSLRLSIIYLQKQMKQYKVKSKYNKKVNQVTLINDYKLDLLKKLYISL